MVTGMPLIRRRQRTNMAIDDDRVTLIAEEISRYLAEHPDAADTVDGITQWWLARIRVEEAVIDVQQALHSLVRGGAVVGKVLPDGTVLYRSASR